MGSERTDQSQYASITEEDVNIAQTAWCDALTTIGRIYNEGGDYRAVTSQLIDDLYDYKEGTVFFKPTLAYGANAFRSTKKGALSYFIGGDPDFPADAIHVVGGRPAPVRTGQLLPATPRRGEAVAHGRHPGRRPAHRAQGR